MRKLPDNSIDLICTDPPYFKAKSGQGVDGWWDSQWDKPDEFLKWIDKLAEQWQRVLKPNGSLYCFASHRMSARVEVQLAARFNVLTRITWNKGDLPTGGRHKSCSKEGLRSFFPASESIIFCDHYGSDNAAKGGAGYEQKCDELRGFVFEPLRAYLDEERRKLGFSSIPFDKVLGTNGLCKKYFNTVQWTLPTEFAYQAFQQAFPGYFQRTYETLRSQYETLRSQYESLRRPFSVTADVPYTDVWTFPTVQSYPGKHVCEKPAELIEHVINASSRPGAVVLDCFAGSGSTLVAAKKLGRQYIGMEIDPHWVNRCKQRLGDFTAPSITMEDRVAWLETQVKATAAKVRKLEKSTGQLSLFDIAG